MICPGPLIWFNITPKDDEPVGAVLECAKCGYIIATGGVMDAAHAETPLLREGLAT